MVQFEQRAGAAIQFKTRQRIRHEACGEVLHLPMRARLVDEHTIDNRAHQVPQDPEVKGQVGMYQVARLGAQTLVPDELPQLAQILHVGEQCFGGRVFRGRTHDIPRIFLGFDADLDGRAQPLAFGLGFDARRYANSAALGHVDEIARRQGDVGREPRALRSQRILDDLDENLIALGDQGADVLAARGFDARLNVTRVENVGGMQESRAFQADLDERGLHARKNAGYPTFVDVADESAPADPLEKHFLEHAVFDDSGARLVRARVDENLSAHRGYDQWGTPARLRSSAVSNSGSPITPE